MDRGVVLKHTYCEHYDRITGLCKVYDIRDQLGFAGCSKFPTLEHAEVHGLPKNCGYRIE